MFAFLSRPCLFFTFLQLLTFDEEKAILETCHTVVQEEHGHLSPICVLLGNCNRDRDKWGISRLNHLLS